MIGRVSIALCGLLLTSPSCDSSPMRMERVSASKTEMRKADLEMSASEYVYGQHRQNVPVSSYVRYTDHGAHQDDSRHYLVEPSVSLGAAAAAAAAAPVAHLDARRTSVLPRHAPPPGLLLAYNAAAFSQAPETAANLDAALLQQPYATDDTANYNGVEQLTEYAAPLAAPEAATSTKASYYDSLPVDAERKSECYDKGNEPGHGEDGSDEDEDDEGGDDDGDKEEENEDEDEDEDDGDGDEGEVDKEDDDSEDSEEEEDEEDQEEEEDDDKDEEVNLEHPGKNFDYRSGETPKKFVLLEFDLPSKVIGELGSPYSEAAVGYKAGAGRNYGAEQYSTHGRNDEEDYKSRREFDTGERGEHYKDEQTGRHGERGRNKKSHRDEAYAEGEKYEKGEGSEGEDFGHSSSHRRGEKTTGFHNVYRKDDYKKDTEFYDEEHKGGHFDKHAAFDEHQGAAEGSSKRVEDEDSGFSDRAKSRKGHYDKGHERQRDRSHELERGVKSYRANYGDYAARRSHGSSKKYDYSDRLATLSRADA